MQSKAADVASYIAEAPLERQPVLHRLRELVRTRVADAEECIEYGMACYKRGGAMAVAFASQKGYLAFYGLGQTALERHAQALKGLDNGKGCVRYRKPEQIDFDLLRTMLRERHVPTWS